MTDDHTKDPSGNSRPQNTGDSSNPVSLHHLFDEWSEGSIVDAAKVSALCTLSTERIQRELDNAFFDNENEWQKLLNTIRAEATDRLVQDIDKS